MKISSERGVAHATLIATPSSTLLAPPPLQPDSPSAAHPLRRSPADARAPPPRPVRAAVRSSDARTVQAVPAPECAISNAGLMCEGTRPSRSLPHHGHMEDFASLATAESSQEYTGADGVRLAGAPSQERGEGLSRALRVEARTNSTRPNTTATAYPWQVSLRPPPWSIIQPPPSRPAPLKHPTPTFHSHLIPVEVRVPPPSSTWPLAAALHSTLPAGRAQGSSRTAPPLVDARLREEYMNADHVRLARAPVSSGTARPVAEGYETEGGERTRCSRANLQSATREPSGEHSPS
ncbi:hypothetical protein GGG16DRAFT_40065, partial [Schizophyllum commune]